MAVRLPRPMPVYVLNLDRDVERMASTAKEFEPFGHFTVLRSPGVLVENWPNLAVKLLSGSVHRKLGTLGCFLAHVNAWERIAAAKEGWGLIVEDDISARAMDRLFRIPLPDDAELVWVNRRMDPGTRATGPGIPDVLPSRSILPVKAALPQSKAAPGGDGYLLSAIGARKLLEAVEKDRFNGHVDWLLLRYSLKPEDVSAVSQGNWMAEHLTLNPTQTDMQWNIISGYCLSPSLIRERPGRGSVRRIADGHLPPTMISGPDGTISEFRLGNRQLRLMVTDQTDLIQKQHARGRFFGAEELEIIRRHLRAGDVYLDIGAHSGNNSLFLALTTEVSKIIPIECDPDYVALLRKNVEMNEMSSIIEMKYVGVLISDHQGIAQAKNIPRHPAAAKRKTSTEKTIELKIGDDLLSSETINFIYIDAQHVKLETLNGLKSIIHHFRPRIFLNIYDNVRESIQIWLTSENYKISSKFRRFPTAEGAMFTPS